MVSLTEMLKFQFTSRRFVYTSSFLVILYNLIAIFFFNNTLNKDTFKTMKNKHYKNVGWFIGYVAILLVINNLLLLSTFNMGDEKMALILSNILYIGYLDKLFANYDTYHKLRDYIFITLQFLIITYSAFTIQKLSV